MGSFIYMGVILLERVMWNLALTLAKVISNTRSSLEGIQFSLRSLARVVMDDRIALDFPVSQTGYKKESL